MKKRLNVHKVVPTILKYIRESYNSSEACRNGCPLVISGTYTMRNIATAALCGLALGPEKIEVHLYGSVLNTNHSLYNIGLDFDDICRFMEITEFTENNELFIGNKHLMMRFLCQVGKVLFDVPYRFKDFMDNYLRDIGILESFHDIRKIGASGFSFAEIALCKEIYKLITEKYEGTVNDRISMICDNTIFPLYWFSDDEVYFILSYIGLGSCPITKAIVDPYAVICVPEVDNAINRLIHFCLERKASIINKGLFNMLMDNIPNGEGVDRSLTYFYMGQFEACYDQFKEEII